MRPICLILAVGLCAVCPLVSEAGAHRGGVRRGYVQPQAYKKPQTVIPENPAVVQARREKLEKLKTDLEAISAQKASTVEQVKALYQDLMAVVDGSSKPAPPSVQKLATDLTTTLSHRQGKASIDALHLAQALKVVMNSAYVVSLDTRGASKASEQLLRAGGAAEAETKVVAADLTTITTQAAAQGRPGMIR